MNFSKKLLVLLAIVSIVFAVGGCRKRGDDAVSKKVELVYYKLFDDEDVMRPFIQQYERENPNVKIKYKKFVDPEEYEELIINELAEGEGPDIFELHNTWVPRHMKKVVPLKSEVVTPQVYEETFVKVAAKDFLQVDPQDGEVKVYGIPLAVDTLALYYNKAYFERYIPEEGKPAGTWEGIAGQTFKLRRDDEDGVLQTAGIALGRADNVAGAVDALYALMLQNDVHFYNQGFKQASFASQEGKNALETMTDFADSKKKQYAWSADVVSEESELKEAEAFLTGKTAMMVGYADLYGRFPVMLKNLQAQGHDVISERNIRVAPLPQVAEAEEQYKTYASYFGETVSRNSKHPDVAWDFIKFLVSAQNSKTYMEKTKRPTARRDLIEEQRRDPIYGIFVAQLSYAESIPVYHARKFSEFLSEAIDSVADGDAGASEALAKAQQLINAILPSGGIYPPVDKK